MGFPTRVTLEDLVRRRPALRRRLAEQIPHRDPHRGGHLPLPARVHHHVRDPAHEILAEPDLRVHGAGRRHHLARSEVADMRRDRRRADVDGRSVHPVLQARPHRHDVAFAVDRHGDSPVTGPQRRLERLQHREVAAQVLEAPLLAERRLDPAQIPRGVVHVRLRDLHESQPHHRIDADRVHLGALAHHLPVHLAVGGNIDDDVATELRRAAQAAPRSERRPLLVVAPLDRPEIAQVLGPGAHPVLGELPDALDHLAAAADPPPAAHRVEIDPSARAASRMDVPRENRPRRPEGVKTMSASLGASSAPEGASLVRAPSAMTAPGAFSHDGPESRQAERSRCLQPRRRRRPPARRPRSPSLPGGSGSRYFAIHRRQSGSCPIMTSAARQVWTMSP